MSLNFVKILLPTIELVALGVFEKLMNSILTTLAPFFEWIFLILEGDKDSYKIVASVLYCSIYHCTNFEKNELKYFSILISYASFITDLRIIPEGQNILAKSSIRPPAFY